MTISLPNLPKQDASSKIRQSRKIILHGQRVTFERSSLGWVATGWEDGIPVARKPVQEGLLESILIRYPENLVVYL